MPKLIYEVDVWSDLDKPFVMRDMESVAREKCTVKQVTFPHENDELRKWKKDAIRLDKIIDTKDARIKELADELMTRPPRKLEGINRFDTVFCITNKYCELPQKGVFLGYYPADPDVESNATILVRTGGREYLSFVNMKSLFATKEEAREALKKKGG